MASTKRLRTCIVALSGFWSVLLLAGLCTLSRGQTPAGVGTITTYAGPPDTVDGAQATSQFLDIPVAVRPDNVGGFYVISRDRVYGVAANGALRSIAGTGVSGFSGDGGPARIARLNQPRGIAVDGAGNLFIADSGNHRVRKVTSAGIITTIAGNGSEGSGGDGGPATSAALAAGSLAVDVAGNLFIAGDNRIRKVSADGIITTVAGNGSLGSSGDGGPALSAQVIVSSVVVDGMGNLFIGDGNSRVRKITPSGTITTIAGNGLFGFSGDGGPATAAQLNQPFGIALDGNGNLFIADFANHRIRKVTAAGIITTVGAALGSPFDVAVTATGNLLIADGIGRIQMVTSAGIMTSVAGTGTGNFGGDGGPAVSAQTELLFPTNAVLDKGGNLFVADASRIRKVSSSGTITTVAGARDLSPGTRGIVVDGGGNLLVADAGNHRIRKISSDGTPTIIAGSGTPGFSGDGGPATSAQLNFPSALALDAKGNLFIADNGNRRIRKMTPSGMMSTVAGIGVNGFGGDGGPAVSAMMRAPNGLAVDMAGNLFLVDTLDNRIRKINPAGIISTVAGDGTRGFGGDGGPATSAQLNGPAGIATDTAGNLFIADSSNHRVRRLTPAGIITTIVGTGSIGFSGDGGPATSAQLTGPTSVAVDSAGNLYVVDASKRIRKITFR